MDNKLYKASDFFMLRCPSLPIGDYVDSLANVDDMYQWVLKKFNEDNILREIILVSSSSLYEALEKKQGDKEKIVSSFLKYYIRITTRPTPFGLSSGITIGEFDEIDNISKISFKGNNPRVKRARVDSSWLLKLVRKLEMNKDILQKLRVKVSGTLLEKGSRIENKIVTQYGQEDKDGNFSTTIKYSGAVKAVLYLAKEYINFNELMMKFVENTSEIGEESIYKFLLELIEKEYLITDLRPIFNISNPLGYVCKKLIDIGVAEGNEIKELEDSIDEYNKTEVGEGQILYKNIICSMEKICRNDQYLQVDMRISEKECVISTEVLNEIESFGEILGTFGCRYLEKSYLKSYKGEFIERYSEGQEVPLLELTDESMGIGYPATYSKPSNKKVLQDEVSVNEDKITKFFAMKMMNFSSIKSKEVIITKEEIEKLNLNKSKINDLPTSFELNFLLNQNNDESSEGYDLVLGANIGSGRIGKTFGRFMDLFNESEVNRIKEEVDRDTESLSKEIIYAQISSIHPIEKCSNVVSNFNFLDYELPIGVNSSKDEEYKLSLDDLVVGMRNGKFYLKSRKKNKEVVFYSHDMLNYTITYNIYRLLLELSNDNQSLTLIDTLLMSRQKFWYVPRIKFNNIILFPQTWLLSFDMLDITTSDKNFEEKFYNWAEENELVRYIYLGTGDNRLVLDIEKKEHVRIIFQELKKSSEQKVRLQEVIGGISSGITIDNKRYCAEIVVPIIRKAYDEYKQENIVPKLIDQEKSYEYSEERVFLPFDEWIYLKLYGDKNREDEIIGNYINPFVKELYDKKLIKKMFFIRYSDEKPHIRLRLKCVEEKELELYKEIKDFLNKMYNEKLLFKVTQDTYFREVERYGGIEIFDEAEDIFNVDSIIVSELLKFKNRKMITIDSKNIAAINIVKLMDDFGFSYEEQLKYFDKLIEQKEYRKEFSKIRKELMKICNSDNYWKGLRETEEGELIYNIISMREDSIKKYRVKLEQLNLEGKLTNTVDNIIGGIIHMFCNRFFGINRGLERESLALARHTLYSLKYFKNAVNG
ncbi:lantibiotic dehydratase [Clostridium cellulovorans]|uniref:Lantibiotic dehydratase domain protein n=1 Tax=Clostridium cellulovorans (strain ATCC 35296 / DSM 3052 / OCM 3 / 743B) TaxID=573061 RepID=D9SNC6_CLOC7|nr:lantibiotic dehydratase [Clostridium cellulovorans]ADL53918.1 Lantibiotic dehydratase domain protein [Clostridium cellulovorans 743B]